MRACQYASAKHDLYGQISFEEFQVSNAFAQKLTSQLFSKRICQNKIVKKNCFRK
jgi:hypothetical protein